ncbi:MAG: 16S rRNA (adenine(1518)-N(6)/adenine(1519)-N(6))-dimethyltransferase RsmA [Planctomycetia bacterium]|nr:16S rRNA (adenine(1518)-N(6)/adenine(1519)-N(6))-dimethyltransferase RsmA [Planctomycetia bacterium]
MNKENASDELSTGSSRNQTRAYLMRRFETLGIHPREKLGQNFLIDLNLLRLLHESAQIEENDVVLEVGTGTGSLTQAMAEKAAQVITVEVDPVMHEMAKQELADRNNVRFLMTDILYNKNRLSDEVLNAVREELAKDAQRRFKLCANLPYSIATPLMSNLLLSDLVPASMTVTIQKEVADRIVARPGSKDYGALSVWMQALAETRIIRIMPPSVFWPRPKVDSAIIQIVANPKKRARIPDLRFFHQFVRSLFLHRRKYIRSVLCSAFKRELTKAEVDSVLARKQISETVRAENLAVRDIFDLSEAFRALLPNGDNPFCHDADA